MKSDEVLLKTFLRAHPYDAARTIERLPETMTASLLEDVEPELAARIFDHMTPSLAAKNLQLMTDTSAAMIIEEMSLREATRMLRKIPPGQSENLLARLQIKKRLQITRQLRYPGDTVAALMNPYVFTLPHDITVAEALKRIERDRGAFECELYVVNAGFKPLGTVYAAALLRAGKHQNLVGLVNTDIPHLPAHASIAVVKDMSEWTNYQTLPVVEKDGSLVGVLHFTDIQIAEETGGEVSGPGIKTQGLSLLELCWVGMAELLDLMFVRDVNGRKRI